ncbi:pps1 dual specificty phosphatase [Purpureocillium lavendulum]|uniref:Pps1 dual specificty phosphatase n=1 Tax=Purpureocillium lavendulum TaxID=1247861 RepID=A0AB34FR66_9HYPO|nr:pps1 dual specificty phosphatase [Purpureocillium lavendulum]
MTTIALPRPIPHHGAASTLSNPVTPPHTLQDTGHSHSAQQQCSTPAPLPNKHIPICPTGPSKVDDIDTTPPASPTSADDYQQSSLLYPPEGYERVEKGNLSIYELDADQVVLALDYAARQPLPSSSLVFPWLHGLHPSNQMQQTFFMGRRRSPRRTPSCLRGVTLVKADGDLSVGRLKGAIAAEEFMRPRPSPDFIDPDPVDGFSVRNFHIQSAKVALTSDIVVYGDDIAKVRALAWDIALARSRWRQTHATENKAAPEYNTFVCTSSLQDFERDHSNVIAIDSAGNVTGKVLDFVQQERREMWDMTEASEISHNVFMGPTPEPGSAEEQNFDILIECSDMGRLNPMALQLIAESMDETITQAFLDFPSSGSILPPTWSHDEADGILETCRWIYHLSHGTCRNAASAPSVDRDGDCPMSPDQESSRPRKILLHCADGYTESSMLGIAYFSYSTGRPVPQAWLHLHTTKHRNFFAYPTDVALLTAIAPRLLSSSPVFAKKSLQEITRAIEDEPAWFTGLDGSFPSRILDYLYLGNIGHANNPELLREMGIRQILSVGETAAWRDGDLDVWGSDNVCLVQGVQDNGIDPLTDEFARCLDFIATLVHCRVGVSRSATICIAEVMKSLDMTFPRAYCFVRARRLNVIIQPHLRFAYELLKWEEWLQQNGDVGGSLERELEWGEITRQVALMNRPYSR